MADDTLSAGDTTAGLTDRRLTASQSASTPSLGQRAVRARIRTSRRGGIYQAAVLAMIVGVAIAFSAIRPESFPTWLTMQAILTGAAPTLVVALGLTVLLVLNEFDLSVGAAAGLCSTAAIIAVSDSRMGAPVIVAVLIALAIGAAVGAFNGLVVSYFGGASFVATLATGTFLAGLDLSLLNSGSIYEGIPESYASISTTRFLGVSSMTYIAFGAAVVVGIVLRHLEVGRFIHAIGANREAARLSGIRVKAISLGAFALVGAFVAAAGVLISSQSSSASPNAGSGLMLPAYAAVFIGSALWRPGHFTVIGTIVGTLFLQMVGTGLTLMNVSGAVVAMFQGGILLVAVLLARLGRNA